MNQWLREFIANNEAILSVIFFVPVLITLYAGAWLMLSKVFLGE